MINYYLLSGSQLSAVSWDHFFESLNQYFISLRQEAPPVEMQAYHYYRCGITPQEVDGLRAVLQLIARVVEKVNNFISPVLIASLFLHLQL